MPLLMLSVKNSFVLLTLLYFLLQTCNLLKCYIPLSHPDVLRMCHWILALERSTCTCCWVNATLMKLWLHITSRRVSATEMLQNVACHSFGDVPLAASIVAKDANWFWCSKVHVGTTCSAPISHHPMQHYFLFPVLEEVTWCLRPLSPPEVSGSNLVLWFTCHTL